MRSSASIRSPRTEQHMQPLASNTVSSVVCAIRSWSRPISPNSLTMTTVPVRSGRRSRRLSSVVLPLPRNPVSTVTGMRSPAAGVSASSAEKCPLMGVPPAPAKSAACLRAKAAQCMGLSREWIGPMSLLSPRGAAIQAPLLCLHCRARSWRYTMSAPCICAKERSVRSSRCSSHWATGAGRRCCSTSSSRARSGCARAASCGWA